MIVNNSSFFLLRLLETSGIGVSRVMSMIELAKKKELPLGELLKNQNGLDGLLTEKQLDDFIRNEDHVSETWEKLQEMNVKILPLTDNLYPYRFKKMLGKKAPPLLMALGNVDLLKKTSVGFCGSRKASEKGLETTWDCADQLGRQGVNIISGYAAGVDMSAHRAALECGGTTTIVLCEGVLNFKIKQAIKNLWDWERIVIVSEFLPGIPWSVRNAMQRNKTICALSNAMILIEAGNNGGSIEAGRASLKMGTPLFAPVYEGMPDSAVGNQELLCQGARPLLKSRKTGRANLDKLISSLMESNLDEAIAARQYETFKESADQLTLFEHAKNKYKKNK